MAVEIIPFTSGGYLGECNAGGACRFENDRRPECSKIKICIDGTEHLGLARDHGLRTIVGPAIHHKFVLNVAEFENPVTAVELCPRQLEDSEIAKKVLDFLGIVDPRVIVKDPIELQGLLEVDTVFRRDDFDPDLIKTDPGFAAMDLLTGDKTGIYYPTSYKIAGSEPGLVLVPIYEEVK